MLHLCIKCGIFQVNLVDTCCSLACKNIDDENALSCLELSLKMNLMRLRLAALAYIGFKFSNVMKNGVVVGQLSFEAISLIARNVQLRVGEGSEDDVVCMIKEYSMQSLM